MPQTDKKTNWLKNHIKKHKNKTLRLPSVVNRHLNLINKIIEDKRKKETRLLKSRRWVQEVEKFDDDTTLRETIDNEGDFFGNSAYNDKNFVYNDQPYFEKLI